MRLNDRPLMNDSETDSAKQEEVLSIRQFFGVLFVPVLVCLVTILVSWLAGGTVMAGVAGIAAIACLAGVVAGHVLSVIPRGELFFSLRLMLSSTVRVALPLLTLLVCKITCPQLLERGMAYFVILFYLVGLSSELITRVQRLGGMRTAKTVVDRSVGGVKGPIMSTGRAGDSQRSGNQ